MMVVIVLLGILTAMIVPEFRGTYEAALLRTSARQLVAAANLAYSQAVTTRRPHRLCIDAAAGRWWLEARGAAGDAVEGPGFVELRGVPGSAGRLPPAISAAVRAPGEHAAEDRRPRRSLAAPPEASVKDAIDFRPDGTAQEREVVLEDREGFRVALRIQPATARVRVVKSGRGEMP